MCKGQLTPFVANEMKIELGIFKKIFELKSRYGRKVTWSQVIGRNQTNPAHEGKVGSTKL